MEPDRGDPATVRTAWIAGLAVVLVGPVLIRLATAPPTPLFTQLSTTTGLLALSSLLCAAVLPSRVRSLTRAFGIEGILDVHRSLGILAASLVALHLACVVAADPANVALLSPYRATPAAQAAAVATVALVALVPLAVARTRARTYELWRWCHLALAAVVLVGSALHVWYLKQLVRDAVMSAVLAALLVTLAAVLLHRWVLRTVFDPSTEFLVREVRRESPTVSTLVLHRAHDSGRQGPDSGAAFRFAPGQFAWLRLGRSPRAEEHPFTIASSAHDPAAVEFTVRHRAGGFSAAVAHLAPGRPVWVDGPHGAFTLDDAHAAAGVVMVAGGVGVTPMMSMLRTAADRGDGRRFHLVLSVARREDVLFRDELAELAQYLDLDVTEVLHGGRDDPAPLTTALARLPAGGDHFVCGSPTLVAASLHALALLGVPPDDVRTEQFDPV